MLFFRFVFGNGGYVGCCVGQCPPWWLDVGVDFLHGFCDVARVLFDEVFQVRLEGFAVCCSPVSYRF